MSPLEPVSFSLFREYPKIQIKDKGLCIESSIARIELESLSSRINEIAGINESFLPQSKKPLLRELLEIIGLLNSVTSCEMFFKYIARAIKIIISLLS